ncbi:hypothetical protein [Bailinhaonella thermotolerans]|uniref:Ig-like domain-containing protein n=1 Tax=Bailinhaonella thermotolerans TaxID=1070861 RepID=A0A3A4B9V8_9ACTN|nr:hypothetical protein [Bailinhaonella thermotolerans]RJL35679.1 hypothetical protein D5H75_02525 [Bailinhaonella thermotolerans]
MKRISSLAAVPVLAAALLAAPRDDAHALVPDQVCVDNVVLTWDPPLTNTPRTLSFTATGRLSDCTSTAYSSGSYTESGTVVGATCTSLLYPGSATRTFVWTSGGSSVFSYNWNSTRLNGNIVYLAVGSINPGGVFGGDNAKEFITVPAPDPTACSGSGVSQLFGVGTLEIGL